MRGMALTEALHFWDAWDLLTTHLLLTDDASKDVVMEDVLMDSWQHQGVVGELRLQPADSEPTRS